jgi:hypothetical protein
MTLKSAWVLPPPPKVEATLLTSKMTGAPPLAKVPETWQVWPGGLEFHFASPGTQVPVTVTPL